MELPVFFARLSCSSCSLIRVFRSGAFRIILRSLIELTYARVLRALIWYVETSDLLPAEKRVPLAGPELRPMIRRWAAAPLAGLSTEFACNQFCAPAFMLVERGEFIACTCLSDSAF
jgi:hypothetical protein